MKDIKRAVFNINNTLCAVGFLACNVAVQSISLFMVINPRIFSLDSYNNQNQPTILNQIGYTPIQSQLRSVVSLFRMLCGCSLILV
jgi:hypothetical protein